ncbi:MAG: hypothetical protein WBE26_05830 [Phycisphaerae bacterium]
MQGDVLLFILLLVLGWAACLFGVIYMLCRFVGWIARGAFGVSRKDTVVEAGGMCVRGSRQRACPNGQCRKVEYRDAHYCSQCGTRLM